MAREVVLESLRTSLAGARSLAQELGELAAGNRQVTLAQFLEASGRDLSEVYGDDHGWTKLQRMAGLVQAHPDEEDLSRRLGWLVHIDEAERLRDYRRLLGPQVAGSLDDRARARMLMLEFQLHHRGVLRVAEESVAYLTSSPVVAAEARQLCEVLEDRLALPPATYPLVRLAARLAPALRSP